MGWSSTSSGGNDLLRLGDTAPSPEQTPSQKRNINQDVDRDVDRDMNRTWTGIWIGTWIGGPLPDQRVRARVLCIADREQS